MIQLILLYVLIVTNNKFGEDTSLREQTVSIIVGVKMKNIFLSDQADHFCQPIYFSHFGHLACQPVAIMMPQSGALYPNTLPNQGESSSLAEEPAVGELVAPAVPNVFAHGYYVRAPGYVAAQDVFAHGYYVRAPGYVAAQDVFAHGYYVRAPGYMAAQDVFAHGYYVRAPGYMAEESAASVIDVAATPYFKSLDSSGSNYAGR